MKNVKNTSKLVACSIAVLLSACGGSGSEGNTDDSQPYLGAAHSTSELDVPVMFDWSSDKAVTLSLLLHDASGKAAAKTHVTVYEMPKAAALDDNREPTDAELQQVSKMYTGYTDSEGRISTSVSISAHALSTKSVYVKTKLMGVSATAVVPVANSSSNNPHAQWVFGPSDVATEILNDIDPQALDSASSTSSFNRSAVSADYFLTPFNQNYHSYYGHMPGAQAGDACNVQTDDAKTQCQSSIDSSELAQLATILQDGTTPPEKYSDASQEQRSLVFNQSANVTVSFLQESAGYANTLGFFTYNSAAVPTDSAQLDSATILFPNTSYRGSGGYMETGDSVSLGEINPLDGDDAMGFYIAANGWNHNRGQGTEGYHFYSLDSLNPEEDQSDNKHFLLIAKDEVNTETNTRRLWLAFEDIRFDTGTSDRDYNDLVIQLDIFPADAVVNADLIPTLSEADNVTIDADNDGVLLADDIDDNDATRSYVRYYPAEQGWATLLAEDNWPVIGDFDMNDMVVRYKVEETIDSQSRIKDVSIEYVLEARGAAFHNGFAVAFGDAVFADNVESALLNQEPISPLTDATKLAYQIFDDAWTYADRGENGCWTFNTVSDCANQDSTSFTLELSFAEAVDQSNFPAAPYNPFLTAHKVEEGIAGYTRFHSNNADLYTENGVVKDIEIHMPNSPPTQGQDVSMFGTGDDASNGVDRFYVSGSNLPWVLNVPYQMYYPAEYTDIAVAYPEFSQWVASGGEDNLDWYLNPADDFYLYDSSYVASSDDEVVQNDEPTSDNLSLHASASGRSLYAGSSFSYVHDGNKESAWIPAYSGGRVTLHWPDEGEIINTVIIREQPGSEGSVRDWRLVDSATGYELARGTGLNNLSEGVARIEFEDRTINHLSFIVDNTNAGFLIGEFETYLE